MLDILPRVLSVVPRSSEGCLLWRNWWPSEELTRHGFVANWMYTDKYREKIEPEIFSGKYNLVVTPRFVWQEPWMLDRFSYTLRKASVAWAYEIDDDMFSPDIVDRQVGFALINIHDNDFTLEERAIHARAQMEYERIERIALLDHVDGLTVSTDALANRVRMYTQKPIHVVPNAMNIGWFNKHLQIRERSVPPLTIGYSGGWRPFIDIQTMVEAWARVAKRFPDVKFVIHGQTVPEIIRTLPANQLHVLTWSDIEDYPSALKNLDIACCSVSPNDWNMNKSCIKWYEMSMAGAAVVASHTLYGQEITDGYDGLLATTVDEWEAQLCRLVVDHALRKQIQNNAVHTVSAKHNIETSWTQWLNAWTKITLSGATR